jgi:hypothetical protein
LSVGLGHALRFGISAANSLTTSGADATGTNGPGIGSGSPTAVSAARGLTVQETLVNVRGSAGAGSRGALTVGSIVEDFVITFGFAANVAMRRSRRGIDGLRSAKQNYLNIQLGEEEMNICAIFPFADCLSARLAVDQICIDTASLTSSASYRTHQR